MEGRFAALVGCLMKAGPERRAVGGGGLTAEIEIPKGLEEGGKSVGERESHLGLGTVRQGYFAVAAAAASTGSVS